MAAVSSPKPASTWQEALQATILKPILDEDPAAQDFVVTEQNAEELTQRLTAWSFCVLKKPAEDLLKMAPFTPEKVAKLHLMAWHAMIQKVAKIHLNLLTVQYHCKTMEHLLSELSLQKNTAPDSKQTVSVSTVDDYEVVTVEPAPLTEVALLSQKIALLKKWIEDPSLLRPDKCNLMAVKLYQE